MRVGTEHYMNFILCSVKIIEQALCVQRAAGACDCYKYSQKILKKANYEGTSTIGQVLV